MCMHHHCLAPHKVRAKLQLSLTSMIMIQVALKTSVGLTPLHNAASNSHVRVIETLIRAGAAVNARAGSNATALFIAAQNGHAEVRCYLSDYTRSIADMSYKSFAQRTAQLPCT